MSTSGGQSNESSQSSPGNRKRRKKTQSDAGQMLRDFLHRTGLDEDLELLAAHAVRQGIKSVWQNLTPVDGNPGNFKLPPDEARVQGDAEESSDPYVVMGVHRNTPPEILRAVYLAWAKNHHPDVGGDPETFKRVNTAWEQIKKERGI